MTNKASLWFFLIAVTFQLIFPLKARSNSIDQPMVRTIAGSGEMGYQDGPSRTARFLMPVSVAPDSDKSLLIVDQAAQRIRRYADGEVTTIAGSGNDNTRRGHVQGGYKNGPGLSARFNEPTGIAIAPDGSAYITDELNSCIRKLSHGVVSTFAGDPTRRGSQDGPLDTATFNRPRAITITPDGTMYIADYDVGVRQISRDGSVTTLETPKVGGRHFVGIAASGVGDSAKVLVTEDNGLYFVLRPSTAESNVYNGAEGGAFPRAYAIAAANDFEFVATDLAVNAIRLIRLPDKPQVTQVAVPIIAGDCFEEAQNSGGFADGPVLSAKFYSPLGIAIVDKNVIVADSGNRRIRSFPLPNLGRPIGTNLNELQPDDKHYRILMTGASHSFWATDWETSIPGIVESDLNNNRLRLAIPKPVRASVARIDSAGLSVQANYLMTFASSGQVNLVVMMLATPDLLAVDANPGENPHDASVRIFTELRKTLAAAGTSLIVNVRPEVSSVSEIDDIFDREGSATPVFNGVENVDAEDEVDASILRSAGVSFFLAPPLYLKYEQQPGHLPLWSFQDSHENLNGRLFAAAQILKQIEAARPWLAAHSHS